VIIEYISCDERMHREKITLVLGYKERELTCYRDRNDWFDLDVDKLISITEEEE